MTGSEWVLGGRYRVRGRIGSGGMAEVFRAEDELLARDVAVKVFRAVPATPDTAVGIERQRAELHALARLNHPNLITLYDGSVTENPAYLVMELIVGPNLGERIERGLLAPAEVRAIAVQICDALTYVHAQGMVHRDVKPANILLGTDVSEPDSVVRARLSDFGIVRLLGTESMTSIDSTLGTAAYLAPEQARGSSVGPPADIYALGLTLLEAFTGTKAFDGPALEAAAARLHRDPAIPASLPAPWPTLLPAMTAREPDRRPSAAQIAKALRGDATGSLAALLGVPLGNRPRPGGGPDAPTTALGRDPVTGATTVIPGRTAGGPPGGTAYLPAAATGGGGRSGAYPPSAPPRRRAGGPPPSPRRPIAIWIALGLLVLVLLIVGIALVASSGGGGGPAPSSSPPSRPSSPASTSRSSESSRAAPSTPPRRTRTSPTRPPSSSSSHSSSRSSSPPPTTSVPPSSASTSRSTSSAPTTRSSTSTKAQAEPARDGHRRASAIPTSPAPTP